MDDPKVISLPAPLSERCGYTLLGSSVTEPSWLDALPSDRLTLILAEGLFMHLRLNKGSRLLERLTARFPSGELAFDALSLIGARLITRHRSVGTGLVRSRENGTSQLNP